MSEAITVETFGLEKLTVAKTNSEEQWKVSAKLSQTVDQDWQDLFQSEWGLTKEQEFTTVPEISFKKKNTTIEIPCLRIETHTTIGRVKDALKKTNELFPEWQEKRKEEREREEAEAKARAEAEAKAKAKSKSKGAKEEAPAETVEVKVSKRKITAKTGLIFGSSTGNTTAVAEMIEEELGGVDLAFRADVSDLKLEDLTAAGIQVLLVGIPTWDTGELQEDWRPVYKELDGASFKGIKIAMFGLGDAVGYTDNFQDAMGIIFDKLVERGAETGYGYWPTKGYEFGASKALVKNDDTKFCGLAIDNDNESDLTESRVKTWVNQLKDELGTE